GKALSFLPLVQTSWANSACVKRVPHMSAVARPKVSLTRRPAAERAADAWARWLAVSLNLVTWHKGGSISLRIHAVRSTRQPAVSVPASSAILLPRFPREPCPDTLLH